MTEIEIQWESEAPEDRGCMALHCTGKAEKRICVGPVGCSTGEYFDLCQWHEPDVFDIYKDDMKADQEAAVDRAIKESYYGRGA